MIFISEFWNYRQRSAAGQLCGVLETLLFLKVQSLFWKPKVKAWTWPHSALAVVSSSYFVQSATDFLPLEFKRPGIQNSMVQTSTQQLCWLCDSVFWFQFEYRIISDSKFQVSNRVEHCLHCGVKIQEVRFQISQGEFILMLIGQEKVRFIPSNTARWFVRFG